MYTVCMYARERNGTRENHWIQFFFSRFDLLIILIFFDICRIHGIFHAFLLFSSSSSSPLFFVTGISNFFIFPRTLSALPFFMPTKSDRLFLKSARAPCDVSSRPIFLFENRYPNSRSRDRGRKPLFKFPRSLSSTLLDRSELDNYYIICNVQFRFASLLCSL